MTIEALLAGDLITVQAPTIGSDPSAGGTFTPWVNLYASIPARVEDASAHQMLAYAMQGMHITHRIFTQQSGIVNGHRIITSTGLVVRVVGVQFRRGGLGSIPDYYVITGEEIVL